MKAVLLGNNSNSENVSIITKTISRGLLQGDMNEDGIVDDQDKAIIRDLNTDEGLEKVFGPKPDEASGAYRDYIYQNWESYYKDSLIDIFENWEKTVKGYVQKISLPNKTYYYGNIIFFNTKQYALSNIISAICNENGEIEILVSKIPYEALECSISFSEGSAQNKLFVISSNDIKHYFSLNDLAMTEANTPLEIFNKMDYPSELSCKISAGGNGFPAAQGMLKIEKDDKDSGTATFVDIEGNSFNGIFNIEI